MYKLYIIHSDLSERFYFGVTKNSLKYRLTGHKCVMRKGSVRPLYCWMRKYQDTMQITLVKEFSNKEDCFEAEVSIIKQNEGNRILNAAPGGEGGYKLTDPQKIIEWKKKLKLARVGRRPALGLKHTDANKELFRQQTSSRIPKYPVQEVVRMRCKDAITRYGISKTHYLRLRRKYGSDLANQIELNGNQKEQSLN